MTALTRPTSAAGSFEDPVLQNLENGIHYAMSWIELEGWIDRARLAYEEGDLHARQVEILMEQALRISRCVPENN